MFSGWKGSLSVNVLPQKIQSWASSLEITNKLFEDLSISNGAIIISVAGRKEYAFEDAKWNNGVFTSSVKKALLELQAETNGDVVSGSELLNYVCELVYQLTGGRRHPTTRRENIEFDWKLKLISL